MGTLRVGLAKVDLTPPLPVLLDGYPHRDPAVDINDPIYARSVVLDDGKIKACHVCLDLCFVTAEQVKEIKREIEQETGIKEANVTISVTHNHSAPQIAGGFGLHHIKRKIEASPFNHEYAAMVNRLAAASSIMAHARLAPAKVGFGRGSLEGISGNRRIYVNGEMRMYGIKGDWHSYAPEAYPDYSPHPIDPDVGVVRFDTLEGDPLGVVFNFTAHALAAGPSNRISGDYPAAACRTIERLYPGITPLFLQGACGNVHPRLNGRERSYEEAARKGRILAYETMQTFETLDLSEEADMRVVARRIELPYRQPKPDLVVLRESLARSRAQLDGAVPDSKEFHKAAITHINAYRDLKQWEYVEGSGRMGEESLVQVWAINDCAIVFVPGEVFVELGLEIKQRAPQKLVLVAAYSHGLRHYIPVRKAYDEGGYESTYGTVFAPEAGERIVAAALDLLDEVRHPE
ncbi:MAG: neutral/alkaline non-lysosomal ceramidase N-terminal domain-containing protein [Bacteroidota bacterium]